MNSANYMKTLKENSNALFDNIKKTQRFQISKSIHRKTPVSVKMHRTPGIDTKRSTLQSFARLQTLVTVVGTAKMK